MYVQPASWSSMMRTTPPGTTLATLFSEAVSRPMLVMVLAQAVNSMPASDMLLIRFDWVFSLNSVRNPGPAALIRYVE